MIKVQERPHRRRLIYVTALLKNMKTKEKFMKKTSALLSVLFLFLSSCGDKPPSDDTYVQDVDIYVEDNDRGYRDDRHRYHDRHDHRDRDHDRDDNRRWK